MPLETGTYISDLVITNPAAGDGLTDADNHMRLIKSTIKTTFPNINGAVSATDEQLSFVTGVSSAIQTQMDLKAPLASPTFTGTVVLPATTSISTVSATEIGYLDGVTSAIQTQMDLKAPLASPALTGNPTAPTAAPGDNDTSIATTAFVAALGALKADLASPTFTGTPAAPTAAPGTNTTQVATTAYADAAVAAGASSSMTLIATLNPTSGTTASVTSGIDADDRYLFIEVELVSFTAAVDLLLAVSGNGGTNYGTAIPITVALGLASGNFKGICLLYGIQSLEQNGASIESSVGEFATGATTIGTYAGFSRTQTILKHATGGTSRINAIQFSGGTFDGAGVIKVWAVK